MWAMKGYPIPPADERKRKTVVNHAKWFGIKTLVETGTCLGQMVNDTKDVFDLICSIELDEHLCNVATKRFANDENVYIVQGDSAKELPKVIQEIDSPILFWLDAHYSGGVTSRGDVETPIASELVTILKHPNIDKHVILIDDACLFENQTPGYPSLTEVEDIVGSLKPEARVVVKDDIIRIYPTGERMP